MVRERVAAHEGPGLGGDGADERDRLRLEREDPVIGQERDAALGHPACEVPVPYRVEVPGRVALRLGIPARVQQAVADLLLQHPQHGAVQKGFVQASFCDLGGQRCVRDRLGQLDVQTRRERQPARVGEVGGDVVHEVEEGDGSVVADDGAGEPPPLPQHVGEQLVGGGHRDVVDVRVRVHDRLDTAQTDRHLEARQHDVLELAAAHRNRGVVARRP